MAAPALAGEKPRLGWAQAKKKAAKVLWRCEEQLAKQRSTRDRMKARRQAVASRIAARREVVAVARGDGGPVTGCYGEVGVLDRRKSGPQRRKSCSLTSGSSEAEHGS